MKKRLIYLLAVFAFFSCGVMPRAYQGGAEHVADISVPDSAKAFWHYAEGLKAVHAAGDSTAARLYFDMALAEDSLFAPAYYQISNLLAEKDPQAAIPFSRKALELDSSNVTYLSQLGRIMITSGNYEEALPVFGKLLKKDPNNPANYRMLAALYDYSGQPYTAISILDSAEHKLGRYEQLSSFKRKLLIDVRLFDKAIEETDALIKEYPYDDMNYLIKADLYGRMGRDSSAMANYREALRIDSTNIMTLVSMADFYRQKRDNGRYLSTVKRIFESDGFPLESKKEIFTELTSNVDYYRANYMAINTLATTLLVKYPNDFSILKLYATHLIRSGEIEQALTLYKSYIEGNPAKLPDPYYAVIDIEAYMMRPDSVVKYSDMALKHFPKEIDLYLHRGFAMGSMKRDKEALVAYRQGFRNAADNKTKSRVAGVIGDHYHQMGKQRDTYAYYRRALKLDPDNYSVLNNYAYYLSEEERELEKALEMSGRANELSPGNSTFLDTHAWILYKLGRYEEAKKFMLQAVSLDRTGSDVLLLHYGDILYKLGDEFMAKTYWNRALEKGYDPAEIAKRLKSLEK